MGGVDRRLQQRGFHTRVQFDLVHSGFHVPQDRIGDFAGGGVGAAQLGPVDPGPVEQVSAAQDGGTGGEVLCMALALPQDPGQFVAHVADRGHPGSQERRSHDGTVVDVRVHQPRQERTFRQDRGLHAGGDFGDGHNRVDEPVLHHDGHTASRLACNAVPDAVRGQCVSAVSLVFVHEGIPRAGRRLALRTGVFATSFDPYKSLARSVPRPLLGPIGNI